MEKQRGMEAKVFVGCEISHDLRHALIKSTTWKQANIAWKNQGGGLKEVKRGDDSYLGFRSEGKNLSLEEITHLIELIRTLIAVHCPEIDSGKLKIVLFPEIMVA